MQQQLEQTTALPTLHELGCQSKELAEGIQRLTRANAKLKFDLEQEQWHRQQLEKQLNKGEPTTVKEFHPSTIISSDIIPEDFWERLEWGQIAGWSELALFLFREKQTEMFPISLDDAVEQMGSDYLKPDCEEGEENEFWNNDVTWENCLKNLPSFTNDQLLTLAFWGVQKLVDDANQLKALEEASDNE